MFKSPENQKPLGEYCRSSPGWLDLLHWRMACYVFPQCRLQCTVLLRIDSWNVWPRAGVERLHIAQHHHDGDKHNNRNSNDDIGDNDNDNNHNGNDDHRNDHHDHHNNDNNNGNLATGARLKIVGFQWHFRVECMWSFFLRQDRKLLSQWFHQRDVFLFTIQNPQSWHIDAYLAFSTLISSPWRHLTYLFVVGNGSERDVWQIRTAISCTWDWNVL